MVDRARDRNLAAAPKVLIEQLVDLVLADALARALGAVRQHLVGGLFPLRLDVDVLRFLTVLANDNVKDIEARVTQAREYEAEQARRREERELLEAERAASEAAQAAEAAEAAAGEQAGSVDGQLDAGELGAEDQDSDANREDAGSEELETVAGQAEKPIPEATAGDDAEAKG